MFEIRFHFEIRFRYLMFAFEFVFGVNDCERGNRENFT